MLEMRRARLSAVLVTTLLASGCGGGGGDGSDDGGGSGLRLSTSALAFSALTGDFGPDTAVVQISWTSASVAQVLVGVPPGQSLPGWLQLSLTGNASPLALSITRTGVPVAPGHYTATLRVVTGDASGNLIDLVDLPVSLDVVPRPTVSPDSVAAAWVESEQPGLTLLSVNRDARVTLDGASVDAGWLSVGVDGDSITLAGNAASKALAPGAHGAEVTITVSLGGRSSTITVPVSATVTRALSGPAQLAFEVNASTTEAALAGLRATIATATQAGLTLDAEADVPWLTPGSPVTTGTADNLALAIPKEQLDLLENGVHHATVTLTPREPNLQPLLVPVALTVRLPEVHVVAPVAFSDTVDTDYVIVRGQGFDDPAAVLRVDGVEAAAPTVVSDTELRFVPGARAAGDYVVDVTNELALARGTANLRVASPPSYAGTTLDADIGLQDGIVPTPINGVVFTSMCYFCGFGSGTPSTVQRFAYDAVAGTWSRTQYNYPELYDIAMTSDESQLLVLTRTELRFVNPATMATTATVVLPSALSSVAKQLAVMNDGLVIIQDLQKAYSLRDGTFVPLPGIDLGVGIAASRDGSRAFFGAAVNDGSVAYRYYDASTGSVVTSSTFQHYSWGRSSRHAERFFANARLFDHDLVLLATLPVGSSSGDLSPDGQRVYGIDTAAETLRRIDVSNPQQLVELTPISLGFDSGRVATDPRGEYVYVAGRSTFVVVDVR